MLFPLAGHRRKLGTIASLALCGWLAVLPAGRALAQAQTSVPDEAPLTLLGELWSMPDARRQAGAAIDTEFLVTVYDPHWKVLWAEQNGEMFYLHSSEPLPFKSGDLIRLTGRTKPGSPEIQWNLSQTRVLREHAWTQPQVVSNLAQAPPRPRWAELEGYIVRAQELDPHHMLLTMRVPENSVSLQLLTAPSSELHELPGMRVAALGAFNSKRNLAGSVTAHEIWVPGSSHIRPLHPVAADPVFLGPLSPIAELRHAATNAIVRVRAQVKEQKPGRALLVEDGTELLTIETWQTTPVSPGEIVDAAGFPRLRGSRLVLAEGLYRPAGAAADLRQRIRFAADVRALSLEEADQAKPVSLRGVVTWSARNYPFIFLEDSSAGICVELAEDLQSNPPYPGDAIALTGVTSGGGFAPWIRQARFQQVGNLDMPQAALVTLDHAMTGAEDSQWVQMEGYLRSVGEESGLMRLDFSTRSGEFMALTPPKDYWHDLVGAVLKVKGACGAVVNKQREISAVTLWIPEGLQPDIEEPVPKDPFAAPERAIEGLRRFHAVSIRNRRIRVSGTVIAHLPGRYAVLQDGTHGLNVLTREKLGLQVGDRVEAVGFVGTDRARLLLRDALVRKTGRGETIQPRPLNQRDLIEQFEDSTLISTRCTLLEKTSKGEECRLTLQSANGMFFDALCHGSSAQFIEALKPRSVLDLIGVAQVLPDDHGAPFTIRLLLRGPGDIQIVEQPPLLTLERAGILLVLAVAVVLGLAAWTRYLQRKVKRQTAQMLQQLHAKASLQSQYRSLVENASDWIFTICEDGLFTSTNAAGEAITGHSPTETLALRLEALVHPDDALGFMPLPYLHSAGAPAATQQFRIRRKDGAVLWLELKSAPLREPGRAPEWLGIARDVTARKNYEEQMRLAKEAAEANNRARGEFLANMSHEIRTPMNGVLGMCQLLLDTGLSPEQRDFAETIRTSSEALLTVINDILDLSKIEAGKLDLETIEFNLRDEVESVMELLAARAARKPIEISAFVPPELPCLLRGDNGRLRQVLLNLAGNAVKFTDQGEVALSVALEHETETHAVVRFEVADTGIGIAEDAQTRLFQPFMQADSSTTRKFGGTGLGLAISSRIVSQMGGKICVRSAPGQGSTFHFAICFEKQPQPESIRSASALRGVRALVVDDNATNRRIVRHYLAGWSMAGESADCGADAIVALVQAARNGHPFALALIDCQMPGMDGFELARQIKSSALTRDTVIILLTSLGTHFGEALLAEAGIQRCLRKPFRQADLLAAINATLELHRTGAIPAEPPSRGSEAIPSFAAPRAPAAKGQALRILLAEDNPVNQKVALRQLQKLGHTVDLVANGREALAALDRATYDAVLMDCQMPEMDGYEATREIRRHPARKDLCIVAMTANAMEGDREKCLSAGMNDYIAKPVRIQDLEAALLRAAAPASA